jgi:very-short-patch-repair endonuclease
MSKSELELQFESLLRLTQLPEPVREFKFHPFRRWRFDFAWPSCMVAVELEGGTFSRKKSRHTTGSGHQADCVKYNAAALGGWCVLKYTAKDLKSRPLQIVDEVTEALSQSEA